MVVRMLSRPATVLVAGVLASHPHHALNARLLTAAASAPGSCRCTTHAIAEAYRVLVSLPLVPRCTPDQALALIRESLIPRLSPVALTAKDYDRALAVVSGSGLGGGAIYDALHLMAADRLGAAYFVTANQKHFACLAKVARTRVEIIDPSNVSAPFWEGLGHAPNPQKPPQVPPSRDSSWMGAAPAREDITHDLDEIRTAVELRKNLDP